MSESSQMIENDIHFRAENNSNLNWELGIHDDIQEFKRFMTMEFQEIKQQMTDIISERSKPPVRRPTLRNQKTFMNTKSSEKPSYTK